MKLVITEDLRTRTIDVRLHPTTKKKIAKVTKIAYWTVVSASAVVLVADLCQKNSKKTEEK